MPDPINFYAQDMELLTTGQYCDARLTAGTRVWNIHKSIVCQRSGFFNEELSGSAAVRIRHQTENEVELLVQFMYSGRIEAIDNLAPDDCVQLAMLGEQFDVIGMAIYAEKALLGKLKAFLQVNSTVTSQRDFETSFMKAVVKAYDDPGNTCQILLADFAWAARGRLLEDSVIAALNTRYHLFGSHVLTAQIRGPQSPLVQADDKLIPAAKSRLAP